MNTDKLAEMLAAATKGPWFVAGVRVKLDRQDTHAVCHYDEAKARDVNIATVWFDTKTGIGWADAALIALTPDLAAEVLRLRAFVAEVRDYKPDVISGRAHDPQDEVPDMMELDAFEAFQSDAAALLKGVL